jgi:predicted ATPase
MMSVSVLGNLPVHLTRFFGRESETAELEESLAHVRLVTLTGAPGSGKSRLGIEAGRRLSRRFRDGVWLVELASVSDPENVAGAVSVVMDLGTRPAATTADALVDELGDRELLLILDNCEHVVAAAATLAGRLVERCPAVRVLATSRLALGLSGEQVWSVAPLDVPAAVELFIDRAQLVSSDFHVDGAGRKEIGRICERLDGLPLAIELAAAWTRVLSPGQVADRLDDALALLATSSRIVSPRQETMEATVDWSYRLLAPTEQRLFSRLSVFAGGFDLAAAQAVAGSDDDVLSDLTALVDHSLVQAEPAADGSMHYRILEPLRQYGAATLACTTEDQILRQRHAEHYLEVARECNARFDDHGQAAALARLEQEGGNLAAALEWARTQPSDLGLRFCAALGPFWIRRGPRDPSPA